MPHGCPPPRAIQDHFLLTCFTTAPTVPLSRGNLPEREGTVAGRSVTYGADSALGAELYLYRPGHRCLHGGQSSSQEGTVLTAGAPALAQKSAGNSPSAVPQLPPAPTLFDV